MMIEENEDTNLIQNILEGNKVSEELFFNKYKRIINDHLKCKYPKLNDIEDCVSEILIKVFYSLDKYDVTKSSVKTWVMVIAKNYMIDKWRSSSAITTTLSTNAVYTTSIDASYSFTNSSSVSSSGGMYTTTANSIGLVTNGSCSFSTSNTDFENCNSINYISTQLSPTDFTLLDMKYVQGYDYNEIGKEFNVTSSTISNRVNYIKTKLKKNNSEILYD